MRGVARVQGQRVISPHRVTDAAGSGARSQTGTMATITLAPEHALVGAVAMASGLLSLYLGGLVGSARRKYKVDVSASLSFSRRSQPRDHDRRR